MAFTRRGRFLLLSTVSIVLVAVLSVLFVLFGGDGVFGRQLGRLRGQRERPTICPLTGVDPKGLVPNRPALALKVENLPASRPQTGLSWADIVYEESVEGGITRFIAVYQCQDAERVEPIRSARLTDPGILVQFGRPLFGYAGGVPEVVAAVRKAGVDDVNYKKAEKAYGRDPEREEPHNLYAGTEELYAAATISKGDTAPGAVFEYSEDVPQGRRAAEVHLPFSYASDVYWRFDAKAKKYLRYHADEAHTLSDGTQVAARNVVVQVVQVKPGKIRDVLGVPSPEVTLTGGGRAYVFRNGRVIEGRWERPSLSELTRFLDANGDEIPLMPGNTWVELLPSNIRVSAA